jgi:hypothetical protein
MARRLVGRALLALVLALGSAPLAAPLPAMAQAPMEPPAVLLTPVPGGTTSAALCMQRAQMQCRWVQRFVVREGVRTRWWTWECGAAAHLLPGPARSWRLVSVSLLGPMCSVPRRFLGRPQLLTRTEPFPRGEGHVPVPTGRLSHRQTPP